MSTYTIEKTNKQKYKIVLEWCWFVADWEPKVLKKENFLGDWGKW